MDLKPNYYYKVKPKFNLFFSGIFLLLFTQITTYFFDYVLKFTELNNISLGLIISGIWLKVCFKCQYIQGTKENKTSYQIEIEKITTEGKYKPTNKFEK